MKEKLETFLQKSFDKKVIRVEPFGKLENPVPLVVVHRVGELINVLRVLRADASTSFDCLELLFVKSNLELLDLTYLLRSSKSLEKIVLRCSVEPSDEVESVDQLWPNAAFFEQEIESLFGLRFKGTTVAKIFTPLWMRETPLLNGIEHA